MGTRCNIGFYKNKYEGKKYQVLLYFHFDGYPTGILPTLVPYLQDFEQKRGLHNIEYCSAWCMYSMIKGRKGDDGNYLSHGIAKDISTDIEYYYSIYSEEKVLEVTKVMSVQRNKIIGEVIHTIPLHEKMDDLTLHLYTHPEEE